MPSSESIQQQSAPARLAGLDALRGIAVLLVLGRHMPDGAANSCAPLAMWHRMGWVGVDLFFVLSGFLVSGLLFREYLRFGNIHYGRFLLRRGFKIYPAFYVLLLVTYAVACWTGKELPLSAVVSEALFVQNYGPALFPQSWSLAVEEHFYFLLPLLIIALYRASRGETRDPFRKLPVIFVFAAVLVLAGRVATNMSGEFHLKTHIFPTHLRIDALLFGVLLSYAWHFHFARLASVVQRWKWLLVLISSCLAMPAFVCELGGDAFVPTIGLTGLYLASGLFLLLFAFSETTPQIGTRLLATIGTYSYSIYLWHIPVRFWLSGPIAQKLNLSPGESLALYFGSSLLAGGLMAHLIEWPALALRDRWCDSRNSTASNDFREFRNQEKYSYSDERDEQNHPGDQANDKDPIRGAGFARRAGVLPQ